MQTGIKEKYEHVGSVLDIAVEDINSIVVDGNEENHELDAIKAALSDMSKEFKTEIEQLESSSEWDKLCVAYFGETNAGKSTIIESLRIIYNEETRWLEKERQDREFETILSDHKEEYSKLLESLKNVNTILNSPERKKRELMSRVRLGVVCAIVALIIGFVVGAIVF
ncbi:MAG: hypothetical protein IKH75_11020 [Ruminococcus sp.]|nr:hypothetical protein [Ruminococcus sp.]